MHVDHPAAADDAIARYSDAAMATVGLGAAWVVARGVLPFGVECPSLAVAGVPCPMCGLTRLADHTVSGDLGGAITADPAGLVVLTMLAVLAVAGVARRLDWQLPVEFRQRPVVVVGTIALGLHWITVLLGGGFVRV